MIKHNKKYLNIFKNNGKNILWIASWMLLQLLIQLPFKTETNLKKESIENTKKNTKKEITIIYIIYIYVGGAEADFLSYSSVLPHKSIVLLQFGLP